jgi:hypothetical protein
VFGVSLEYELLRAFDAHFHLDRYSIRRHGDIDLSIGELVEEKLQTPIETHSGIALLGIIKLAMPGAFCQRIRLFP